MKQSGISCPTRPAVRKKKATWPGCGCYKFRLLDRQFLLAYEYDKENLSLLALGVHENFYRDIKK